jgi:glutathione S-transferase
MTITYIPTEEAIPARGLRMVVVGNIPSPWAEAAKGILHVKRIPWKAVRLDYADAAQKEWTGVRNAPAAMFDDEPPRTGWAQILFLAERLAPQPALLPADAADRALVLGLAHELVGEQGLAWSRRLQLIHAGLQGTGGFAPKVAPYLGKRYGYSPEAGAAATARVAALLGMFAARLNAQRAAGSDYYVGNSLTAADIYSATALAIVRPLPEDVCAMDPATRAAFEFADPATDAALHDVLLEHRAMVYERHLELPLSL